MKKFMGGFLMGIATSYALSAFNLIRTLRKEDHSLSEWVKANQEFLYAKTRPERMADSDFHGSAPLAQDRLPGL